MMNVRWRMFPLHRHIPRDEQRNIAACARCFAELILYVEQRSIIMCFNLTYIKVLSGSPAKSGPMTLTSENRFPLFFVC